MTTCVEQAQKTKIDSQSFSDNHLSDPINTFFYGLDLKTNRFLHVSSNITTVFGYTKDKFIQNGLSWFVKQIHPDDLKKLDSLSNQFRQGPVMPFIVYRLKVKNGSYFHFKESRCLLYDTQGQPSFLISRVEMA